MSKTKKTPQVLDLPKDKHKFKGFVNFYPTKYDKDIIRSASTNMDKLTHLMTTFMEEGYSFKFAYDLKGNCMQVLMIGERTTEFNQGYIQSARHTDTRVALSAVLYQHMEMAGEQQWDASTENMFSNDW